MRGAALWGAVWGAGGFLAIYGFGYHLQPDLSCYARGGCAWSSPAYAGAGELFGLAALRVLTVASLGGLGVALYARAGWRGSAVGLAASLALPYAPGFAAGPDALGALAVVALSGRRRAWPLSWLAHLEAMLVLAVWKLCGRLGLRSRAVPVLAGFGAIAAMDALGALHGAPWRPQLQTRYLLPGLALGVAG